MKTKCACPDCTFPECDCWDKTDSFNELLAHHDNLVKALEVLVLLKDYKDKRGKTSYYMDQQPRAWLLARETLWKVKQPEKVDE
jgi:hypothetical protein